MTNDDIFGPKTASTGQFIMTFSQLAEFGVMTCDDIGPENDDIGDDM